MSAFDVLIVTAVPEEYAAVREVSDGGLGPWREETTATGVTIAVRTFAAQGGKLTIAVTQALGMGGANAVIASVALIAQHGVRCLAMCGVCAGKRGDVALGDVIVADRVWQYGAGKRKTQTVEGKEVVKEEEDIEMYHLHPPAWKQAAERFAVDRKAGWLASRPRSYEAQGDWILERVLRGVDPTKGAASKKMCADLGKALERLWKLKLLKKQKLELTAAGKKHIELLLLANRGKLPKAKPLEVLVGPIASGTQVMQDEQIFARLSSSVRKVLGVEMEAAAIGALAHTNQLPFSVVMKAVMDHADADKSDNFKRFAARASAEVLIAFVRQHVPPRGVDEDPILTPGTSPLPPKAGPAALLNARHQVVPFHGRTEALEALRAWCESGVTVGARLVHAVGGMGKTRLAIELCRQMRERGWRAGFFGEGADLDELLKRQGPLLVVVDYAESRAELRALLKRVAATRGASALRILLLARNADEWWADLVRSDGAVGDLLQHDAPVELPSMTVDREAIFKEAVRAFAQGPGSGPMPNLVDPRYARVLYVHAAALATAYGRKVEVDGLLQDTLDHEERFWREQLRERGHAGERLALQRMRLAVAALTLKGGVGSETEAVALAGEAEMALLLHDLYPGRAPIYVGGLEPDLLGEAMVWRALSKAGAEAGPFLDRVFEAAGPAAIRTGFAVLGRLSEDHLEAAEWIRRLLARDVPGRAMEAFAAAKIVGERTAHSVLGMVLAEALEREGTVVLAERLEPELPHPEQTVSLREVGRWVTGKRLASLPEEVDAEKARLLNNLGAWQSAIGQREEALNSTREAVDLYRKLAASQLEAILPDLAGSLNTLGKMQNELGQREEAMVSMKEAVDLCRSLGESQPEAILPYLALSLHNLGAMQRALGQLQEAISFTQEAVDLYHSLSASQPDTFLPYLASSLNNLGVVQLKLQQPKDAIDSAQKAVEVYLKLSESRPEAFLPDLAMCLTNLGTMQSALNRPQAALVSTEQAVDLYHTLSTTRPRVFRPDLAMSLNNLGAMQIKLGRHEPALLSAEQALEVLWPFFLSHPATFEFLMHTIVANLRDALAALGRVPGPALVARIAEFEARRVH